MHCHHEKLVIVDGTLAFVGGIDLTDLAGDRFDGPPHAKSTQLGWHDAAVSLTGPAVADVAAHFAMRWRATTGGAAEAARPARQVQAACRSFARFRRRRIRLFRKAISAFSRRTGCDPAREAPDLSRESVPLEP